jgi:hypothetical protein
LNADTAPLILGFFHLVFIKPNARSCSQAALVDKLEDYLLHLRNVHGDKYSRSAQEYLDEWSRGENAYLRKYYPDKGDEPEYDLTPASEKAIEWLRGLELKPFVGTESRLLTLFQLLREVAQATETDPAARMAALERKRAEIESAMARLQAGQEMVYDPTRVKERYFQIEESARHLLADFRQVEDNFRQLDRRTRERIAASRESKGRLLDEIFGEEDAISSSDEGKSFRAFWELLMSHDRQEELQALLEKILALKEVQALPSDDLLRRLKFRLIEAGEKIKKTTASLVEHLRRFLDDQAWLENKRIMEIIRSIESRAIDIRENPPMGSNFSALDEVRPDLDLTMARGLFIPPKKTALQEAVIQEGAADFSPEALYQVHFVDEEELRDRLRQVLREKSQCTIQELCARFPLEKGLAELLAYFNIAGKDEKAWFDPETRQTIAWRDPEGRMKRADVPRLIFNR